jgi:hypothetical protein
VTNKKLTEYTQKIVHESTINYFIDKFARQLLNKNIMEKMEITEKDAIQNIETCLKNIRGFTEYDRFMDFDVIIKKVCENLMHLTKITQKTDTIRYERYRKSLSEMNYLLDHEIEHANKDATIKERKKTFGKYFNNYKKSLAQAKLEIHWALDAIINDQT